MHYLNIIITIYISEPKYNINISTYCIHIFEGEENIEERIKPGRSPRSPRTFHVRLLYIYNGSSSLRGTISTLIPPRSNLPRFTSIIVDDSDMNRFVLKGIIQREFIYLSRIMECVNGREAVLLVKDLMQEEEKHNVIIIFMDLDMPVMNGIEATRELTNYIPIVVVTAYASPQDKTNSLSAGANLFLHKPLSTQKVIKAIQLYIK